MRKELYITRDKEWEILQKVMMSLDQISIHGGNTLVVNVSPDYSSTVAMHIAHHLSHNGEMCDMLMIDVPYPDEDVEMYTLAAKQKISKIIKNYQNYLLVEAGVIRGTNYNWLTQLFKDYWPHSNLVTLALFENTGSHFKSDIVGEYYDNETQDLTFYYERENKHWV